MNRPFFLKQDINQWLNLERQSPLQNKNDYTTIGNKKKTFMIDGAPIACYITNLLDGKLALALPKLIRPIAFETNKTKTRSYLTLANVTETVKITMYHLSQKVESDAEVLQYYNQIRQTLKKAEPSLEWLLGGVKDVCGMQIAFFEVIATRHDIKVYNLSFFLPLEQRVLSGNFMCAGQILKVWRPVFYQNLESFEVKDAYKT